MRISKPLVWGLAALVLVGGVVLRKDRWVQVKLSPSASYRDVFKFDIYSPYDPIRLIAEGDEAYAHITDFNSESKGRVRKWFHEYAAPIGRIRRYEEHYTGTGPDGGDEYYDDTWLEVYPGATYLEDLIQPKYLSTVSSLEGEWRLTLATPGHKRYVTLELERGVVKTIIDRFSYPIKP